MQLDFGAIERGERVGDRVRVVTERTRVDHDCDAGAARSLDRVDQRALVVRLVVVELVAVGLGRGASIADEVVERRGAVDLGLPLAELVQRIVEETTRRLCARRSRFRPGGSS